LDKSRSFLAQQHLHPLPEETQVGEEGDNGTEKGKSEEGVAHDSVVANDGPFDRPPLEVSSMHSLPNLGVSSPYESTPPSGSDDKVVTSIDVGKGQEIPDLTPPVTETPPKIPHPSIVTRRRSKSLETETLEAEESSSDLINTSKLPGLDSRRALNLPEHGSRESIKDDLANKSALAVNRQLYRAHRQMRLSVLEACKRFEDQKISRARDTLMKEQVKEAMGAGLVMRHGTKFQVTSDAIRKYLDEAQAEQQVLLDKANRRGGRGRSARKKTISDMSAMMNPSLGQDEMGLIASKATAKTPDSQREVLNNSFNAIHNMPDLGAGEEGESKLSSKPAAFLGPTGSEGEKESSSSQKHEKNVMPPNLPEIDHVSVRKATVPGQFHKTLDPFSSRGMYGGSKLNNESVRQIQGPGSMPTKRSTMPPDTNY